MTQIQLSNAQTAVLTAACTREDGAVFPVTAGLKGGAVGNVCKSLLKHGLIEEIKATDLNTVWRHDEARGPITLRATALAHSVLNHNNDVNATDASSNTSIAPPKRKGTKQAMLIEMLQAENGATIAEITAASGWQAHSIRGMISGVLKKKLELDVTSEKIDGRGRVYKLAQT